MDSVNNLFPNYIKSLPENLWVRQYLLTKGLIEQMPNSVKTYAWRSPQHVTEFMAIDFTALKHSGLLKKIIEGYTYLVERFPLEEVTSLLNQAIDKVIVALKEEPSIQQAVAQYWFTFLESHSLFGAAEYLALKMLNDESCVLDEKSANLFEQYRKIANGKIAPNIDLNIEGSLVKDLKSIAAQYKLVVFGASWCPTCKEDYSKLKEKYADLKANKDVEIVYISIDTDTDAFEAYYGDAPFITFCDGKGWKSQAVNDYHIFATPSYFLLDKELNILEKIKSITHLESWLASN
ncbi:thioredoxin family protein [Polaribacter sp.]|nr:thioredoxin family protein [Polaribacter sp.]